MSESQTMSDYVLREEIYLFVVTHTYKHTHTHTYIYTHTHIHICKYLDSSYTDIISIEWMNEQFRLDTLSNNKSRV